MHISRKMSVATAYFCLSVYLRTALYKKELFSVCFGFCKGVADDSNVKYHIKKHLL